MTGSLQLACAQRSRQRIIPHETTRAAIDGAKISTSGRVPLEKRSLNTPVQQLTFSVEINPQGPGGILRRRWETTEVSVPFVVQ